MGNKKTRKFDKFRKMMSDLVSASIWRDKYLKRESSGRKAMDGTNAEGKLIIKQGFDCKHEQVTL